MFKKLDFILMAVVIVIASPFMLLYYCGKGITHGAIYTWEEFTRWIAFAWGVIKS